jgi:hypothetical protein
VGTANDEKEPGVLLLVSAAMARSLQGHVGDFMASSARFS